MKVTLEVKRERISKREEMIYVYVDNVCVLMKCEWLGFIEVGERYYGDIIEGFASTKSDADYMIWALGEVYSSDGSANALIASMIDSNIPE